MRTASYCRFSSDMQRETSIRDQLRNIENYCTRMEWPKPTTYEDQAISGARNDRPGYQSMLASAALGAFDILLVDDLSRLSRDHIESAQTIRRLKYLGIRVIGTSDGTDTARETYKLETGIRGLMSEFYIDDLAKKTHRGMTGQALNGFSVGSKIYGYKSVHETNGVKKVIDEETSLWVRYIFERFSEGATTRKIIKELHEKGVKPPRGKTWTHSALHSKQRGFYSMGILCNTFYIGKHIWNRTVSTKDPMNGRTKQIPRPHDEWITVEMPELRIIDDELWKKCESRLAEISRATAEMKAKGKGLGTGVPKYLFSGLLKCGVCGEKFTILNQRSYGCSTHHRVSHTSCTNKLLVKRSTLEEVLLRNIKDQLLSEEAYKTFETEAREFLNDYRPDPVPIKKKISDAQKEVDNLMTAIKAGIITASTKSALEAAEEQVVKAQKELKDFDQYQPTQMLPRARDEYKKLVAALDKIEDVAAAREGLRKLVGEVILKPEDGLLTAEVSANGLTSTLQIACNTGAASARYLHPFIRFAGLK